MRRFLFLFMSLILYGFLISLPRTCTLKRFDYKITTYSALFAFQFLLKYFKNDDLPIITDEVVSCADDIVAPYVVKSTNARVTMSSAIALINKYILLFLCNI